MSGAVLNLFNRDQNHTFHTAPSRRSDGELIKTRGTEVLHQSDVLMNPGKHDLEIRLPLVVQRLSFAVFRGKAPPLIGILQQESGVFAITRSSPVRNRCALRS
jgi:hypothetical protein